MLNLIRFALLIFALGVLTAPLLDNSGALEEFAFALAEDAADHDAYLALPQIVQPSDNHGNGPLPQLAGNISRAEGPTASFLSFHGSGLSLPQGFHSNRPLYLLYHNFLFYDCLA
ncbi:MAG: hypothetical protein KDD19_06355 [Phaeodactylibacter sp.]|nr:hypothetical protein [Phaeodactylibacter sp.]